MPWRQHGSPGRQHCLAGSAVAARWQRAATVGTRCHWSARGKIMPDRTVVPGWLRRVSWPVLSTALSGSTMPLLERFGLDPEERRQRQAFLGLATQDSSNVRKLRAAFAEHARHFAERFYEHLLAHPHTASFLRDPQQLERLTTLQASYFAELLEGTFDEAYFEGRLRVGLAHQQVGLEPDWYLGAYNQYIQLTFPLFARAFGDNLDRVLPLLLSLVKVIFLDIGLALETYFQQATEQLQRRNQELQQALSLYCQSPRREEQLRKLISHEVRGGLAAVITGLEDLLDASGASLAPGVTEQLDNVSRRCWSLSNILKEMLTPAETT